MGFGEEISDVNATGPLGRQSHNSAVQQLRGIAISLVLLQHFSLLNNIIGILPFKMTNPGYSGVELFFIISGYVVMVSLQRGGWNEKRFIVRRAFRLFPCMFVFIALCFLVLSVLRTWPEGHFTHVIFGVSSERYAALSFGVLSGTLINLGLPSPYVFGAMWSLSVEFQFYAAVALGLVLFSRWRLEDQRISTLLMSLAIVTICAVLAFRLFGFGRQLTVLRYVAAYKFEFLCAGVIIALVPSRSRVLARLMQGKAPAAILCMIAALIVLALHRSPLEPPLDPVRPGFFDLDRFGMVAALLLFSATVAVASSLRGGLLGSSWPGRAMLWLGDRSYTVYLLHFPLLALLWCALFLLDVRLVATTWLYGPLQAVAGLVVCCIVADLCFRRIETPGIALGARLLARSEPRPGGPVGKDGRAGTIHGAAEPIAAS